MGIIVSENYHLSKIEFTLPCGSDGAGIQVAVLIHDFNPRSHAGATANIAKKITSLRQNYTFCPNYHNHYGQNIK